MKKIILLIILFSSVFLLNACQDQEEISFDLDALAIAYPNHDTYYQIFIRSFADSNQDGIGDLKGITENLNYIHELGATAIWLSPFHPSPSYHGYDVLDYYDVNEDYGTLEDLQELIDEAKLLGIDIMMDLVINHSSDQHPWYLEAKQNPNSPYHDYYTWASSTDAYRSFVGGMVDFNLSSEAFQQEIETMMSFYAEMGILKFRLDAAKHFFDDPGVNGFDLKAGLFILELNAFLKRNYGTEAFILSEVFDYYPFVYLNYYIGSDALFNFYGRSQILEKVGNQTSRGTFVSLMSRFYEDIQQIRPDFVDAIFISNHDLDRLKSTNSNVLARQQMVNVLLTLPGSPFIYYGEELDMEGRRQEGVNVAGYGTAYDEFRRTAFLWGDARQTTWFPDAYNDTTPTINEQIEDTSSMYHVYQQFMQLRLNYPALRYGDFEIFSGNDYNIQGYTRTITQGNYSQQIIVIHNIDSKPSTIEAIPGAEFIYGDRYEIDAYGTIMLLIETIEDNS